MTNAVAIGRYQTEHTVSFTLTLTLSRLPRRQRSTPTRCFSPERLTAAKEYFLQYRYTLRNPWSRI